MPEVRKNADKACQKQKSVNDLKAKAAKLEIGDRVLVKNLAFDGTHSRQMDKIYICCNRYTKCQYSSVKVEREDGKVVNEYFTEITYFT